MFSSLLLSVSIVSPHTSCGSNCSVNDIGGFDKEFGFDVQTYNRLENEFKNKYLNYLQHNNLDKSIALNKYDNFLQNDLTILRNKLFDPAQNYSFTIRTNTLLDYASKNYSIYLNRNANVGQTDFDNLKQSSLENFAIYLNNTGIDANDMQDKINDFSKKFDAMLKECLSIKFSDNAQILMQLRTKVINCWEDINEEFAYICAYNHLRDFFDEYEFVVKDQSDNQDDDNELLWDKLLANNEFITNDKTNLIGQDIDCEIKDEWINKLFTISKKKNNNSNDSTKNNDGNSVNVINAEYSSKEIIPGYILTPVLKTMTEDIYANNYYLNIDWQLMSNKYDGNDQKTKDKVTAHLAYSKDEQEINEKDLKNGQLSSDDYQFIKYNLIATPSYQKQNLPKAYFENKDQKIIFSWNIDKIGIEYFLPSDFYKDNFVLSDDPYKWEFEQSNLADMGLKLNGTNLSDLIAKDYNSSQTNNTTTNVDNDNNLKIEEKFVKYCTIKTNSTISFKNKNNININAIENGFIASYNNTKQECEITNNQESAMLQNLSTSPVFNDNAIKFYNKVANYVNSQKIENKTSTSSFLSVIIYIEFGIISICLIIALITLMKEKNKITECKNQLIFTNYQTYNDYYKYEKYVKIKYPFKLLIILLILVGFATTFWYFFIYKPIHDQVEKVNEWNNFIIGDARSNIGVLKRVNGDDKKYFKSNSSFSAYFHNFSSKAFASYFYYFHFSNLLANDKSSIDPDEQVKLVKKDCEEFNKTKEDYNVTITRIGCKIVIVILLFVIMVCTTLYLLFTITDFISITNKIKSLVQPDDVDILDETEMTDHTYYIYSNDPI